MLNLISSLYCLMCPVRHAKFDFDPLFLTGAGMMMRTFVPSCMSTSHSSQGRCGAAANNDKAVAGASSSIATGSKCLASIGGSTRAYYVDAIYLEKFWVNRCQMFGHLMYFF
jgi:hypothetical protein